MAKITDYPAKGKILKVDKSNIVFEPSGTSYQLQLDLADGDSPPGSLDRPVRGIIHIRARKVWTVPSGGNFVAPIFGPPKTIQGRVKWVDDQLFAVQAGTMFIVQMPASAAAVDLANGPIEVGSLVNVTAMPGAMMQLNNGQ